MGTVEQVLRMLEDVTPKRLAILVGLLVMLVLGVFVYERYTASFALARMERSVVLLRQLESSPSSSGRERELLEINKRLVSQFHALIVEEENRAIAKTLSFPVPENVWLWKFLAGGFPWFLLSVASLLESRKKVENALTAFLFAQIAVIFFAGIGALLPTGAWPWLNLVIYPSASVVLVIAIVAIPAFRSTRQASQERAIMNNLRQIAAASDQYFLENGVSLADIQQIIGPDKFIREIVSVAGESYENLVIKQGHPISVVTRDGREVTYHF